jgi:hypothetical protein
MSEKLTLLVGVFAETENAHVFKVFTTFLESVPVYSLDMQTY